MSYYKYHRDNNLGWIPGLLSNLANAALVLELIAGPSFPAAKELQPNNFSEMIADSDL